MALPPLLSSLLGPIAVDPRRTAILLDLDGTVAPIVDRPGDVQIAPDARTQLQPLRDRFALVAFISGRAITELERIVATPGIALAGNHGAELLLPGGRRADPASDRAGLAAFAAAWGPPAAAHGVWLEDKGATLTFHYRTAPDVAAAREYADTQVLSAARAVGLTAAPGRMSVEVRPPGGITKATAAHALLDATPHVAMALAIGDDRTDVDVWEALRARVADGRLDGAITLGVASDETPEVVRAGADALLDGVEEAAGVLAFLARHAAA